jgi:hypothetical protein
MKRILLCLFILLSSFVCQSCSNAEELPYQKPIFGYEYKYDDKGIMIDPKFIPSSIDNADAKFTQTYSQEIRDRLNKIKTDSIPFNSEISYQEGSRILAVAKSQLYYYPDDYIEDYYSLFPADDDKERDPIRENPNESDSGIPIKYTEGIAQPWCSEFVAWCYHMAGCDMTTSFIYYNDNWRIPGVGYIIDYFSQYKTWCIREDLPKDVELNAGDYVAVDNESHSVMVWEIKGDDLHVIDGNNGNQVNDYWIKNFRESEEIDGFGLRFGFQRAISHGDRVEYKCQVIYNGKSKKGSVNNVIDADADSLWEGNSKNKIEVIDMNFNEEYGIRKINILWNKKDKPQNIRIGFSNVSERNDYCEYTDWYSIDKDEAVTEIFVNIRKFDSILIEMEKKSPRDDIRINEVLVYD